MGWKWIVAKASITDQKVRTIGTIVPKVQFQMINYTINAGPTTFGRLVDLIEKRESMRVILLSRLNRFRTFTSTYMNVPLKRLMAHKPKVWHEPPGHSSQ